MKSVWMGLVLGVCASAFPDEDYRTFTGTDGRGIKAKIVKCDLRSGKVTVERENRRKITVPVDVFSFADQAYIKDWLALQNFLSNSKLRVSVDKRKGKAGETSETKRAKPPCFYEIQLDNKSGAVFDGIWVEYCMYMNTEGFKGAPDKLTVEAEKSDVFKLPVQGKHLEMTKEVKLFRYYTAQTDHSFDSSGYPDSSTSYNKTFEDNMEGIRVRIYLKTPTGNTFMREICDPASVEDKYAWKAPYARSSASGKKRNNRKY
ncbi:hypothetical protein [Pontiella sulfatireligans]|uniref:SLA1 homology domain-containing protein n=1 Tax=Pontiella sulfatireligans TaxID=2750658 RepID=A0A6C2UM78_9BACT|nr:hypothetical protein [Pontiella sulfatireligans]VGO21099.1 hypothetical protein SCARR_03168 [Pontiella sulfatireligans]